MLISNDEGRATNDRFCTDRHAIWSVGQKSLLCNLKLVLRKYARLTKLNQPVQTGNEIGPCFCCFRTWWRRRLCRTLIGNNGICKNPKCVPHWQNVMVV